MTTTIHSTQNMVKRVLVLLLLCALVLAPAARAEDSADLARFIAGVVMDPNIPQDGSGNYTVDPNVTYDIAFSFSEREGLQLIDENELTYPFPAGIAVGDVATTPFDIHGTDGNGAFTVPGNMYKVEGGVLKVKLSQNDPALFARLKACANVAFTLGFRVKFTGTETEVDFGAGIIKKFDFQTTSDLEVTKRGTYDKGTDRVNYVVTVKSKGVNTDLTITDSILKVDNNIQPALTLNHDVAVESSVAPTAIPHDAVDYTSVPNGFKVKITRPLVDGEVVTLQYSASVNYDLLTEYGTFEQTSNKVKAVSKELPGGKEKEFSMKDKIVQSRARKEKEGDIVAVPAGQDKHYEQTWKIVVNKDRKVDMDGKQLYDYITHAHRQYMWFTGEGITIEGTREDNSTFSRTVRFVDMANTETSGGNIVAWKYNFPAGEGKSSYVITCKTHIDVTNQFSDLVLRNNAELRITDTGFKLSGGSAQVEIGFNDPDKLSIDKEATEVSGETIAWTNKIRIRKEGYTGRTHFVDDLPKYTVGQRTLYDELIEDSIQVTGLLPGESWKLDKVLTTGADAGKVRTFTIDFYRDTEPNQSPATMGLLPTPDGRGRDITITFTTKVNQERLELAHQSNYPNGELSRWHNVSSINVNGPSKADTSTQYPRKTTMAKEQVSQDAAEIGGVVYPVYRYELTIKNPPKLDGTGFDIFDDFRTEYLRYYDAEGIQIAGGTEDQQNDTNGEISATPTGTGIGIRVTRYPITADNKPYDVYKIRYSLIIKDAAALAEANRLAAEQDGLLLENTAKYRTLTTPANATTVHVYSPYADKRVIDPPTNANQYVAQFELEINKYGSDLFPDSDILTVKDILSENLRYDPDSLEFEPANLGIAGAYDEGTRTITFTNVPDKTVVKIKYKARVLGTGPVTYSNTVMLGQYVKKVEESVTISSVGAGTASNPSITLVKRDSEDNAVTLAGAVFKLEVSKNNGNWEPVKDKNGAPVTFTTGSNGRVLVIGDQANLGWALYNTLPNARYQYRLIETTTPGVPGVYQLNPTPVEFELSMEPTAQHLYYLSGESISAYNTHVKCAVSAQKIWQSTHGAKPSVWLKLYRQTQGTQPVEVPLAVAPLKEATNGATVTWDNLNKTDDNGNDYVYSVQEGTVKDGVFTAGPPAGYDVVYGSTPAGELTVTNTLKPRDVTFSKVAAGQGQELPGAKLTVEKADGTAVDTWTSTGTAKVLRLTAGEYKMIEDQAPLGYNVAAEIEFRVNLDGTVDVKENGNWVPAANAKVQMVDELKPYDVTFSKVAAGQGNELSGAELKVEKADGTPVESWISTGTAKVLQLPAGEYKMIEDQAPLGYNVAAEIEFRVNLDGSVEVKENGNWVLAVNATVQMVDELKPYGVTFSKVAAGQGEELVGAEISVRMIGENGAETLVQHWTSDGTAKVLRLVAGEYKMIEDQAPLGYLVAAAIEFRVNPDGTVDLKDENGAYVPAGEAKVQMVDELKPNGVTFSKVAAGQGQELPGAKLTVEKADGTVVDTWTSTGTAKVLQLPAGEYKMIEDQAPLGYSVAAEIEFRVNLDGSVEVKENGNWVPAVNAKVQMVDELKPYDVTFSKVAAGQGQELPGATLTVKRADGTVVQTWTSTGTAKVLQLTAGEYTMVEDQAPLGYLVAEKITFRVKLDGTVEVKQGSVWVSAANATVQMVDKPEPQPTPPTPSYATLKVPLTAHKTYRNGKLAAGQFTFLLKNSKGELVAEATNDANGNIVFPERTFSREVTNYTYTIEEQAGGGKGVTYDRTVYTVRVTTRAVGGQLTARVDLLKDKTPYDGAIEFVNERKVPETGDRSLTLPLVLTLAAVAMFAGYAIIGKRRVKN